MTTHANRHPEGSVLVPTAGTKVTTIGNGKTESVDAPKSMGSPGKNPPNDIRDFINTVLKTPLSRKELSDRVSKRFKIKIGTAELRVGEWAKKGWIHKGPGKTGRYGLHPHPEEEVPPGEVPEVDRTITPEVAAESGPDAGVPSTPEAEVVPQEELAACRT